MSSFVFTDYNSYVLCILMTLNLCILNEKIHRCKLIYFFV